MQNNSSASTARRSYPTLSGSHTAERGAVPDWMRMARAAVRVLVTGLAVLLAGLFLFPADRAHAAGGSKVVSQNSL